MYGRIFTSLWDGSMRGRSDLQLVFIYLLCQCDNEGFVEVIHQKIADDTGLGLEVVREALRQLEAPDADSRTPDDDGRRLHRLNEHRAWGWSIVNHEKYQHLRSREDRKRQNRDAKRRQRSAGVSNSQQPSAMSAHVDVDVDVDTDRIKTLSSASRPREREPKGFAEFYGAHPRRDGRRAAAKAFKNALRRHPTFTPEDIAWAAGEYAKARSSEDPQFTAMPATWLNQDRFREYFDEDDDGTETKDQAVAPTGN